MANKARTKGTRRERIAVDEGTERGLDVCRAPNQAAGRDLDLRTADLRRIIEVKDRRRLNPHKAVAKSQDNWPAFPPMLYFHRTSVGDGNTQASPDGPTLMCMPVDDAWDLLAVADAAGNLADLLDLVGDSLDPASWLTATEELREAIDHLRERYPEAVP